jgi:hypothetical protein
LGRPILLRGTGAFYVAAVVKLPCVSFFLLHIYIWTLCHLAPMGLATSLSRRPVGGDPIYTTASLKSLDK